MNLLMMVYNNSGATRGQIRMKLDFPSTKWSLVEDKTNIWAKIGAGQSGQMDVSGTEVGIRDQPPGKLPQVVLQLSNLPETGTGHAGTGKIAAAADTALTDGFVYWVGEQPSLSPIRQAMIEVLKEYVPIPVISSDDPLFYKLTSFNTKTLLDNFWEPENKVPAWPADKMPKKNTTFTCCNLTLGCLAGKLGARLGKKVGRWLGAGVLQLDWADKDVPGSWIPGSSGQSPQVGDFYSVNHGAQKFGHVGTIGDIGERGTWVAVDGGQGGFVSANKKDYIKRVERGKLIPSAMNGWVDIDIYFG
jgi:hypothetical protein